MRNYRMIKGQLLDITWCYTTILGKMIATSWSKMMIQGQFWEITWYYGTIQGRTIVFYDHVWW